MYLEISRLLILTKTIIIITDHFNEIVDSTFWTVYKSSLNVDISYCIVFFWNVGTRLKDLSHAIFCWMSCLRHKQLIVSVIINIRITHYAQRCFSDNLGISVHTVAINQSPSDIKHEWTVLKMAEYISNRPRTFNYKCEPKRQVYCHLLLT